MAYEELDYRSTMSQTLSTHGTEIRLLSEEMIPSQISKKKLKDLLIKHNHTLFSMQKPSCINTAESLFRRYGRVIPKEPPCISLERDVSMDAVMEEFHDGLARITHLPPIDTFVSQSRWLLQQYRSIGEEVLRLETILFQKMDVLDKLHGKIPMMMNLAHNDALPDLIASFTTYTEKVFEESSVEENYKSLLESYQKWNLCRQLLSLPLAMKSDAEPQCSICLLEPVSYTIVPCGHTFCSTCSKKQNTTCYICRGIIRERVKLYFA